MTRRTLSIVGRALGRAVACLLLALLIGCEDIDWLWWQGTGQRPPSQRRVLRRKAPTMTRGIAPRPVPRTALPERTDQPAPASPSATQADLYQLLLLSEPSSVATPDNIRAVRLRHATAGDLGRLIEYLYIPAGPGGTDGRYFLVYESPEVWAAAATFALQLDVPSLTTDPSQPPYEPAEAFERAVARFYQLHRPGARDEASTRELIGDLERLIVDSRLDEPLQWAAAMLAGGLAMNWQNDFPAAQRFFTLARLRTTPGSPEELMAWAKHAEALAHAGDADAARLTNLDLLSRSARLSGAYAYKRAHARALAQEKRPASGEASQKQER